ncbi:biotin transporter BioY [Lichenihabitans psoromatis]|uniref:biotin transporter BioY n=1 Tax=Lichenihabitans psoromatis TaxID=2528642 RepID=UPI0010382E87|nr:biotin transporter BioY [Lichenihabitans psoromatis]
MSRSPTSSFPVLPLYGSGAAPIAQIGAVIVGTGVLAASSWIQVPMIPVPITMQTLAITMIGAFYGWRLALATVVAWFAEAAFGLPVLAGGAAGIAHFVGPTGGYLLGFAIAAGVVGLAAEQGLLRRSLAMSLGVMLAANALIIAIGCVWLARFVGWEASITAGATPFIVGGIVKAALATGIYEAVGKRA